jgi:hypothetical protein
MTRRDDHRTERVILAPSSAGHHERRHDGKRVGQDRGGARRSLAGQDADDEEPGRGAASALSGARWLIKDGKLSVIAAFYDVESSKVTLLN